MLSGPQSTYPRCTYASVTYSEGYYSFIPLCRAHKAQHKQIHEWRALILLSGDTGESSREAVPMKIKWDGFAEGKFLKRTVHGDLEKNGKQKAEQRNLPRFCRERSICAGVGFGGFWQHCGGCFGISAAISSQPGKHLQFQLWPCWGYLPSVCILGAGK